MEIKRAALGRHVAALAIGILTISFLPLFNFAAAQDVTDEIRQEQSKARQQQRLEELRRQEQIKQLQRDQKINEQQQELDRIRRQAPRSDTQSEARFLPGPATIGSAAG